MFNLGDEVYLKSGGPVMTVSKVTNDGFVDCTWYNEVTGDYHGCQFEPEMLGLADELNDDDDSFYEDEDSDTDAEIAEADALYRKLTRGH